MSDSAFSGLKLTDRQPAGRDQRLFTAAPEPIASTSETTNERASAPTIARDNERPSAATRERTPTPSPASPRARKRVASSEPPLEFPKMPQSLGGEGRRVARHSHDIFADQVRWMNRLKLELEERFGAKVTGNALVQVAIDMLREDFERNGERSELFCKLITAPGLVSEGRKGAAR